MIVRKPKKTDSKKNLKTTSNSINQDMSERIREKAYQLYEKRGYTHGNDLADWLAAERVVLSQKN